MGVEIQILLAHVRLGWIIVIVVSCAVATIVTPCIASRAFDGSLLNSLSRYSSASIVNS